MRASSELQFGAFWEVWRHARGREHCRGEPGSALSGGYAPDSARAEGSSIVDELTLLCARIKVANRRFLREKANVLPRSFSSYQGHKERRKGKTRGAFSTMYCSDIFSLY